MKKCIAHFVSMSPYSQGKNHTTPHLEKESHADYEKRTWRERIHYAEDGEIFIPPMAFKLCVAEIAKFLSEKIPGKGTATYTKHFEAGILVTEPLMLGAKKDDVPGEWLFIPPDGKRGGGSRVWKCFCVIHEWSGPVEFMILDDTITKEVFEYHLIQAGKFIGLGRFRVRNLGYYGRFDIPKFEWSEM